MRSILTAVIALMLTTGAVFATGQSSQQGGSTGGSSSGQMSDEKTMIATVDNVNKDQKKISITGPEGNKVELTLNNTTKITTATGEQKKIGDLKAGSKVAIRYTGTRENPTVTNVDIIQGK